MLQRPRIKAHLDVAAVDSDKVFLYDEYRQFLLEGTAMSRLAPLLDGTRTLADLLGAVGEELPLSETLAALTRLERGGHLVDGPVEDSPGGRAEVAWWDAAGVDASSARESITDGSVAVVGLDGAAGADARAVREALGAAGISIAEEVADASLVVAVVDDYLSPELASLNARMLESGQRWLLVRPAGHKAWIGPLLRPGETGCWQCLAQRLAGNRQVEQYIERKGDAVRRVSAAAPALPVTLRAGAALAAAEVVSILATGTSPRVDQTLLTFDHTSFETERHYVVRRPQCPACGDEATARSPEVVLASRQKHFTADGGHRVERPEDTYGRLIKHLSPLTGAVSSLKRQTAEDNGVAYSYSAGHNFALMQDSTYFLRKNLRGRSGGKGRTDVQAKVGALCEAIERYAGVFRGDEPRRRASYDEMGPDAVHPGDLLLFSDAQYDDRHAWNHANPSSYHLVPERFDTSMPIDWTSVWSLTDRRERQVPTGYCYFGHPDIAAHFFSASDANGNAAGNSLEEAVLQGLLELVERDSVALWWYNRLRRPAVDLDALGEPYVDAVREHYASIDRDIWMLDLTSDLGIPAFAGVSPRRSGPSQDIVIGFGAHVDPRMAAMRALTEVNQFLPAVSERNPDGTTNYWMDDPDAVAWWRTATLETEPYLVPDPAVAATGPADYAGLCTDDLAEDVRRCVDRITGAGHEVLVLDQTRPDIELNVVKVMAPGLRHFWRRLGSGRLYDVPVKQGWLDAPVAESDLNPVSIFF